MKKMYLLLISVVMLFFLTSCGDNDSIAEEHEQMVSSVEDSTGYPYGNIQVRCVMINDKIYEATNTHYDEIPEHFTNKHTVKAVDDYSYPVENETGANVEIGDEFYSSEKVDICVYLLEDGRYCQFTEVKQ